MNPFEKHELDTLAKLLLDSYDLISFDDTYETDEQMFRAVAKRVIAAGWQRKPAQEHT